MTDDTQSPADPEDRADDQHRAVEACEHVLDALDNGDLSHAHTLLDEARGAVTRAQHDGTEQAHRETAFDCYD